MLSPELTLLIQGRSILSDPSKWAQGCMARRLDSDSVFYKDPEACQWCSIGVLMLLAPEDSRIEPILDLFLPHLGMFGRDWQESPEQGLDYFNDRMPYEKVMAVWDAVIAAKYAAETEPIKTPDLDTIWPDL